MADPAFDVILSAVGASATGSGSTITFQYPAGRAAASYTGGGLSSLGVRSNQTVYSESAFAVTFGPTNITVTLGAPVPSLPANTQVYLQVALKDTSTEPAVNGYPLPDSPSRDGI